jgi:tetratricopeptide (TPR) repeat protein
LFPFVLALAAVAVYANVLPGQFIFDDTIALERFENDWHAPDRNALLVEQVVHAARAVVEVTWILNYAIEGPSPVGFHLVNILIHAAAGIVLYLLLARLLQLPLIQDRFRGKLLFQPGVLAFLVALIWVVHPLNTQAVSYIVQRYESMMALFYLLTLYMALRCAMACTQGAALAWSGGAALVCFLGMMSKEVMISAPIVALLIDRAFVTGSLGQSLRRRWPLFLTLALTWTWLVNIYIFKGALTAEGSSAGFGLPVLSWQRYLLSQGQVILHYLRLSVFPHPLILDYHWLPAYPERPLLWIPGFIIIGVLGVTGLVGVIRNRWWGVVLAFFFLVLGPSSSFIPVADLAFEHRMYLPLSAVLVTIVLAGGALLSRIDPHAARRIMGIAAAVVVVVFAMLTIRRNVDYQTGVSMWTKVTQDAPHNPRGWANLGLTLMKSGHPEKALNAFNMALRYVPQHAEVRDGVGSIHLERGDLDEAIANYRIAVQSQSDDPEYHYNLGRALLLRGDWEEARRELDRAIALRPRYPKAFNNLGLLLIRQGRPEEALVWFRKAIAADWAMHDAYRNLAKTLLQLDRLDEAATVAQQSVDAARRDGADEEDLQFLQGSVDEIKAMAAAKARSAPASPAPGPPSVAPAPAPTP